MRKITAAILLFLSATCHAGEPIYQDKEPVQVCLRIRSIQSADKAIWALGTVTQGPDGIVGEINDPNIIIGEEPIMTPIGMMNRCRDYKYPNGTYRVNIKNYRGENITYLGVKTNNWVEVITE